VHQENARIDQGGRQRGKANRGRAGKRRAFPPGDLKIIPCSGRRLAARDSIGGRICDSRDPRGGRISRVTGGSTQAGRRRSSESRLYKRTAIGGKFDIVACREPRQRRERFVHLREPQKGRASLRDPHNDPAKPREPCTADLSNNRHELEPKGGSDAQRKRWSEEAGTLGPRCYLAEDGRRH